MGKVRNPRKKARQLENAVALDGLGVNSTAVTTPGPQPAEAGIALVNSVGPKLSTSLTDGPTRACVTLAGYLKSNHGITQEVLEYSLSEAARARGISLRKLLDHAHRGFSITSDELQAVRDGFRRLLVPEAFQKAIQPDRTVLRAILEELGIYHEVFRGQDDRCLEDRAFLQAFGVSGEQKGNQQELSQRIGGFWHVIRESTDTDGGFNLSHLSIKGLHYTKMINDQEVYVTSFLPHLSLRSRQRDTEASQLFRGRVIKDGEEIHFLGNNSDRPRFVVMTWFKPSVWSAEGRPSHVDAVRGLITTTNTDDRIISIPIVAQWIKPTVPSDSLAHNFSDDPDTRAAHRRWYDEEVRRAERFVNKYSRKDLESYLGGFGLAEARLLFKVLDEVKNSGFGNFFKLG